MTENKLLQKGGNGRNGFREIDRHPQKAQIIKDLLERKTYREIAEKYNFDTKTIKKWQTEKLAQSLIIDPTLALSAKEQLQVLGNEITKILKACKKELCNPENPEDYDFTPSAYDVGISYVKVTDENKHVKKENLGELLEKLESDNGILPMRIYTNKVDTRKLLIEAMKLAQSNINAIAKITGELSEVSINQQFNTQINVDVSGVIVPKLMQAIKDATEDAPELGIKISDALYEIVEEETRERSGTSETS